MKPSIFLPRRRFIPALSGGLGAHRYWRWQVSYGAAGQNVQFGEIDFLDSEDVAYDLSTGTWTAFNTGGGAPANVADNDASTGWLGGSVNVNWIQVDLGAGNAIEPAKMSFTVGTAFYWPPKFVELLYSDDGVTFTTACVVEPTRTGPFTQGDSFTYVIPTTTGSLTARYWALFAKENDGGSALAATEVEWLASGVDQSTATAFANRADIGAAANAFDNDTGTFWGINSSTTLGWLSNDLGSSQTLDQASITTRSGGFANNGPGEGFFLSSQDGITYAIVKSFSKTGWTSLEKETFSLT